MEMLASIEERFEEGERDGFLDRLTDKIQMDLLLGRIRFAEEEDEENVCIRCGDNIVVGCNIEENYLDFYELQAD